MAKTIEEIVSHLEEQIDATGWTRKDVGFESSYCACIDYTFGSAKPRRFKVVSGDSFATLDRLKIYEVADSEGVW